MLPKPKSEKPVLSFFKMKLADLPEDTGGKPGRPFDTKYDPFVADFVEYCRNENRSRDSKTLMKFAKRYPYGCRDKIKKAIRKRIHIIVDNLSDI